MALTIVLLISLFVADQQITPLPRTAEAELPTLYRLDAEPFLAHSENVLINETTPCTRVRFPSPVVTEHVENNTVHAEYFRPAGAGPFPAVVVLHIAGGDFPLSRLQAQFLAQSNIAALFIKMPYYGERRPKVGQPRMLSADLDLGLRSMRQTVLDVRRACDWLQQQSEIDPQRLGVAGISLGAITGALATAIEPRLQRACLVMGGAKLEHLLFDSSEKKAQLWRDQWQAAGGTKETFARIIAPYDPASYPERLKQRTILMISAENDEVIPKTCSLALWDATGRQTIHWRPCGHYTMARFFFVVLADMRNFFLAPPRE